MLRPADHLWHRLSRRIRHPQYYVRFWLLTVLLTTLVAVVAAVGWVAWRALSLRPVAARLVDDGRTFERQVAAGDAEGAAVTLGRLRTGSAHARDLTSGPAWSLVARLPVVGDDVAAARALTTVAAELTEATRPFETALPALAGKGDSSRVDLAALRQVTAAMPGLAAAVDDGASTLDGVPTDGVVPQIADGVEQARSMLATARGPVRSAEPSLRVLTTLLGGDGPRTYVVLLQQDAEARGTGGLFGSYAVIGAKDGEIDLTSVSSRYDLRPVRRSR